MTSNEYLFSILTRVCKGTYIAYELGKAPSLPWFVYSRRHGEEFYADDSNYARLPNYKVELYFKENDPVLIEDFETALSKLGTWRLYDADYLTSENCFIHEYLLCLDISRQRESEG